jgi:hypothetical protein
MRKGEADLHNVTIIVGSQEQDSPYTQEIVDDPVRVSGPERH